MANNFRSKTLETNRKHTHNGQKHKKKMRMQNGISIYYCTHTRKLKYDRPD